MIYYILIKYTLHRRVPFPCMGPADKDYVHHE